MLTSEQLNAARLTLGWHMDDVAIRAKVSTTTVWHAEKGGPRQVKAETLAKIQRTLEAAGAKFPPADKP